MGLFFWAIGTAVLGAGLTIAAERILAPQPAVAMIDLRAVLDRHVAEAAATELDAESRGRASKRFAQALEAALDDIERDEHVVLLSGGAVVRGAPDLTDDLRRRLDARLHRDGDSGDSSGGP